LADSATTFAFLDATVLSSLDLIVYRPAVYYLDSTLYLEKLHCWRWALLKAVSGVCALGGRRDNFRNFYMREDAFKDRRNSLFRL